MTCGELLITFYIFCADNPRETRTTGDGQHESDGGCDLDCKSALGQARHVATGDGRRILGSRSDLRAPFPDWYGGSFDLTYAVDPNRRAATSHC